MEELALNRSRDDFSIVTGRQSTQAQMHIACNWGSSWKIFDSFYIFL